MTSGAQLSRHTINFRDAIVAGVRAAFPEDIVPTVRSHDGPGDDDFIRRYAARAPAIVVTVLGGKTIRTGGTLRDELQIGLYIITKGRTTEQRTNAALAIRERLLKLGFDADWTCEETHKVPSEIASTNMFEAKIDGMGLALWLMAWEAWLEIPYLEDLDSLDDFRRLWSEIFSPGAVAGEIETGEALAEQLVEMEQDE